MFKYQLQYKEPGYHKDGDLPFTFPPENIPKQIDSNLLEIKGKNGTGKTTLLNILAAALEYSKYVTEDTKNQMGIKRKH